MNEQPGGAGVLPAVSRVPPETGGRAGTLVAPARTARPDDPSVPRRDAGENTRDGCAPHSAPRLLVLGLGNDILCDDAIGLHVVRELRRRLAASTNIEVMETAEMGLSLLDFIVGYEALVLVDAVQTGQAPPGFLHELDGSDLKALPGGSPHFLGVGEMLALGRKLGLKMPDQVRIFAIEVADPFTVSTQMTPTLEQALPGLVAHVRDLCFGLAEGCASALNERE